jgi:ribonucleoside-triphosphate reductase
MNKIKIQKRDGRIVDFDQNKIIDAILAAFKEVDGELTDYAYIKAGNIADYIEHYSKEKDKTLSVEEVQDLVEAGLMSTKRKDVAKAYILYRDERTKERNRKNKLIKEAGEKLKASNVQNQNANVDEHSFGGRMGEANEVLTKQYALDYIISSMAKENHLNNEIYIHDLGSYAVGSHNCLSIPFDDLLANGFKTRQTDIRPAQSINTAFQLVAVIFQLQSLQQFGGVSATHLDWTMVPYVRKSFAKHFLDGVKWLLDDNILYDKEELSNISIDASVYQEQPKVYQYARDMTIKEVYQAVEAMYHNLNTLQSRSGNQLPFSSINYGTCTLPEGRLVIKALLETSLKGMGSLHKTSIFPCSIFQCMKGVNREERDPNYDLFKLALRSTATRLYPNYANVDWSGNAGYDINDPRTYFSTMGKRKLSPFKIF